MSLAPKTNTALANIITWRANLRRVIREFFAGKDIIEVDTPVLSCAAVTDVHIESFKVDNSPYYLNTSPEFYCKRLLCAGAPSLYQLGPVFRREELGQHHQPEFTLLEWYHLGFDDEQLMQEVYELLQLTLAVKSAEYYTYQEVFLKYLDVDINTVTLAQLQTICQTHDLEFVTEPSSSGAPAEDPVSDTDKLEKNIYLDLLMGVVISPQLGQNNTACFIYDYPKAQAALARVENNVAKRFEVYINGIELANGFHELKDANEQRQRFMSDLAKRQQLGLNAVPMDEEFLQALDTGLPDCAGVALGFDRLLMLQQQQTDIANVTLFAK